jgi:tagatose kinase
MKMVTTFGEILVEIMSTRRGQNFFEPGTLIGPYPSGAPAIFIDQVARLGQPCGMIGCIGDDDFGRLNFERLKTDGVDVSAIVVHPDAPTGSAFVTYSENGERHFVFNILHSASGHLTITVAAEQLLSHTDHLHIMGSSLFSPNLIEFARAAINQVRGRGGTLSFDPNIRKELPRGSELGAFFDHMIAHCDLLMPSGAELFALTGTVDGGQAAAALISRGVTEVVVKRGAAGAIHYDRDGATHIAPIEVEELDPTGAGDCFDATYVVCWLRGMMVEECLRYANASGAHKVLFKGPMEGAASFDELEAWLGARQSR